MLQLETRFRKL